MVIFKKFKIQFICKINSTTSTESYSETIKKDIQVKSNTYNNTKSFL